MRRHLRQLVLLMYKNFLVMWRLRLYTLFELGLPLLALPAILITLPNIHDTSTRARSFDPVPVYGGFGDIFQSIAGNDQIAKRACGKVPENRNLTVLYYSTLKDAEVLMNKFSARYVNPYTSASFFPLQKVDSIEEMKEILKNDSVKICSRYFGGIEITTLNSTHPVAFHYRIQMSSFFGQWNLNDNWDQIVFTRPTDLSPIPPQPLYWSSGILSVQRALDKAFLTMTNRSIDYELKLQRAPTPAYHNAAHIAVLSSFYRFGFLLIVVVIQTASEVLTEKESGMKAYLAVMGLRPFIFSFSHWLMGFLKAVLPLVVSIAPVLSHMEVIKAVLIAAYVIIYAASIASFSLLMSSILRSSSAVNKIVLLIWSLTVVMCDWDIPVSDAVLALNPTKAFYFAIDAFVTSERIGAPSLPFTFKSYFGLVMLLVDILWMTLVTIYMENVFPFGDAQRKSALFFVEWLWRRKGKTTDHYSRLEESDESEGIIEPEPHIGEADIHIEELTKVWNDGGEHAVDRLNLKAYRGQVTALLGHNGAGKSTTFSIISGMTSPSSGTVRICGHNIASDLDSCREAIGYCPQTNPLFNYLTVKEHLRFFQSLKQASDGEHGVQHVLNEVQLVDKRNELAKNLSGGMKRKLCVGMALVGGSRVILLDEPTAGMDPSARQNITDILNKNKRDRTFLLTTHYMDEADRLGDRIAIMVKGWLACLGSPDFLKHRFGAGYLLSVDCSAKSAAKIIDIVQSHVSTATVERQGGDQLEMLLHFKDLTESRSHGRFIRLFEELETKKSVKSFGLSLNSMETIFLKVNELAQPSQGDAQELAERQAALLFDNEPRFSGPRLWFSQIGALLCKRFYLFFRKPVQLLLRIVYPLFYVAMVILFLRSMTNAYNQSTTFDLNSLGPIVMPLQVGDQPILQKLRFLAGKYPKNQIKNFTKTDNLTSTLLRWMIEDPPVGIGFADMTNVSAAIFNGQAFHAPVLVQNFFSNAILGVKDGIRFSLSTSSTGMQLISQFKDVFMAVSLLLMFSSVTSEFTRFVVEERLTKFKHQQLLTHVHITLFWFSTLLVDFLFYTIICLLTTAILYGFELFQGQYGYLAILWTLYFFSSVPFVYCFSFLFENKDRAYNMATLWNSIAAVIAFLVNLVAKVYFNEFWASVFQAVFMILIPSFSFGWGLFQLSISFIGGDIMEWSRLGSPMLYMTVSAVVYWTFLCLLQSWTVGRAMFRLMELTQRCRRTEEVEDRSDQDVLEEQFRMQESSDSDNALSIHGLSKYYGRFQAVRGLTFGVKNDECFGLLGVNGAGKTSTFDIITGISHASSGSVAIGGVDISKQPAIGYCPQFDALLGGLTVRQTLDILSRLHGFKNVRRRVANILECVELREKADKPVKSLSGGQKRRLSIGIALLGQCPLILLDEPTAGIDPKARRNIWNLLTAAKQHQCVILLTSHSMAECDALCGRIGFMHRGQLMRLGSPQHLKSRFGRGYQLSVTVANPSIEALNQINRFVLHRMDAQTLNSDPNSSTYFWEIPKRDDHKWSILFKKLDELLACFPKISLEAGQPKIVSSSLTQNSLEQVFHRFSQFEDDDGEPDEQHNRGRTSNDSIVPLVTV